MQTHETDHTPATPEQLAILTGEIALAVAKAKPSFARIQKLLGSKSATRKSISTAVLSALEIDSAPDPRLVKSQRLWAKLGLPLDCLDDLVMPDIPTDWDGVAIIPEVSCERLFALCVKHFPSWKYGNNLDNFKEEQNRPSRAYALGHRGGVEPDVLHRGKSYNQCIEEGLIFLTQKERICIELLRFAETGEHLDVVGLTITSSLAEVGHAYYAHLDSSFRTQVFRMGFCRRMCADSAGGPRQAVFA
ncbi:MAG: hypothetical protein A2845_05265 [Candidatus Lloydbacteria bacterium RIFCSPHIGHO2_01_FULL_49_22]|uniref:Uncharacterized protein n=1 Tax=Candidatus Lloydbacteria bacterium RIFCSPHIGHO2_01_FULL_49_22 TaxID=1798658 RepID=A0A1G2CTF4_9BACT|nr:MAG: hypothetical protein A2845_05265 [Candidatus Lloydbacteria bacterium RIFCSPHIGHO2_01_FULL_49_22]OGZ09166.1 MAG: hypothetical protein A3C14_04250 [Candidatus Lloydbacteria bacterium RIFCSPHIGHO2_02_FULL_50_18]